MYPSGTINKPRRSGAGGALRDGLAAGALAGVVSGIPSTVHALATGADPLAAARAAGNLLLPANAGRGALLAAGALAHTVVSFGWGTVLAVAVPGIRAHPVVVGALAGAVIAAVDLGLVAHSPAGRRLPLIRALPAVPQIADHVAFGVVTGAVLRHRG